MTIEEERADIEAGEAEENVYSEAGREELLETEDEITDVDEGVMKGYDEGAKAAKCVACGTVLEDTSDIVELEHNDQTYRFCSSECAEKYKANWN